MINKNIKALLTLTLVILMLFSDSGVIAFGLETGKSYQYDGDGNSIAAPQTYTVSQVWTANDSGLQVLNNPTDIYIDSKNILYLSDTGNDRVLVLDDEWNVLREIKDVIVDGARESLSSPQGVFVDRKGVLFICDTGNERVISVDENNTVQTVVLGKDIIALGGDYVFKPERVSVDSLGNIYVVSSSVYQGVMRFSSTGEFQTFFAPNSVEITLDTWFASIWKNLLSDEQSEGREKSLPDPYNNIFITFGDIVYTTANQSGQNASLKANNLSGVNILKKAAGDTGNFGDLEQTVENGTLAETSLVDVTVDDEGFVSILDSRSRKIYVYSPEYDLIGIFGGLGEGVGEFSDVVALEECEGKYFVLDKEKGSVTVFEANEYIKNIRKAFLLYNDGLYSESSKIWEEVLLENGNLSIAYRGIGRAAIQQGDYSKALEYLKKGDDEYYYSIALRDFRKEFAKKYSVPIILGAIAIVAFILCVFKIYAKKKHNVKGR